jgi:hypothetical protein
MAQDSLWDQAHSHSKHRCKPLCDQSQRMRFNWSNIVLQGHRFLWRVCWTD